MAAAQYWDEVTGAIFAGGAYHSLADPLDRVFGYVDFRASITDGPLEAITCFAGTMVQEVFVTSEPIRRAAGAAIDSHAERLVDNFTAAIALYPPRTKVTAKSLAIYTQTVVQGGFVMAKAEGNRAPLLDAIAHLKRYLILLFGKEPSQ